MRKTILLAVMILGVFGVGNISVFAQKETVSNYNALYPNTKLERQVRKEILTLPYYGVFDAIGYQVNGNTVTLNGYTVQPITKKDAERAVADIDGVSNVVNNIQVLPLSTFDDRIRVRTYRAIADEGSLYRYFLGANSSIRIIVNNGRVILEGVVNSKGDKDLANIAALGVPGVFNVQNNLQIEGEKM